MGLINSDIPELEGTDTETALANLDELERELKHLLERRLSHITELSNAIISDGGDDEDVIKSIILSVRYDSEAVLDDVADDNEGEIKDIYLSLSMSERLMILKQVYSRIYSSKKQLFKHHFENYRTHTKSAEGIIAYLKNSYNDMAYLAFSEALQAPRSYYAKSVSDVCECVKDGRCEFCILPIETSGEGKLLSFYRMIIKTGLKINGVYDLTGKTGTESTKYALLSLNVLPQSVSAKGRSKEKFFDFLIDDKDGVSLSEITTAAQICSLEIQSIDTMSCEDSNGVMKKRFCLSFKVNRGDLNTFLTYLSVDCPDYIPLGIYTRI